MFDNDQYLYQVFAKSSDAAAIAALDTLWGEIETECANVGNYTVDLDTGL